MHTLVAHVSPLIVIRRERLLPQRGRVLVRKGQKVKAQDVVAECDLTPEYLWLDVARGLGVTPQRADSLLQVKMGMDVEEKDLLAGPVGWAKRVVRAPKNGRVVLAGDGQVLLQTKAKPFELRAGMEANVVELVGERGAILETRGALVQGVWGNSRIETGILVNGVSGGEQEFKKEHLTLETNNAIVLAGWVSEAATLKAAAEIPVRGLILGGLDAALIPLAREMPYPIMVVDGIGRLPMNLQAYQLLSSSERREVSLNASDWNLFLGTRPEVVVPLPVMDEIASSRDIDEFSAGQRVRICRNPYQGKTGILERIIPGKTVLGNGLSVQAGQVRLDDQELVISPLANLEIVG
ncbi:MAG: hypothetical protein ACOY16_08700 [Chloroflexota bacterium]